MDIESSLREPVLGRGGTQVVLDLGNPQVQDFIFNLVDTLMTNYPEIDYIKWDANMAIMNHGSDYLPKDEQSHLYIAYHRDLRMFAAGYVPNIRTHHTGVCQWRRACQLWSASLL